MEAILIAVQHLQYDEKPRLNFEKFDLFHVMLVELSVENQRVTWTGRLCLGVLALTLLMLVDHHLCSSLLYRAGKIRFT